MGDMTFDRAVSLAEPLKQVGQTDIYLGHDDPSLPWALVRKAEAGASYRLNGPSSVRFKAEHPSGLTFSWSVDFEGRDANGRGVSLFDRARLRDVMMKLSPEARKSFAGFLEREVLSGLKKRSEEIREALNKQIDSEDCVRGLILFGSA